VLGVVFIVGGLVYLRAPLPLLLEWRPASAPPIEQQLADRAAALARSAGARRRAIDKLAAQPRLPRWTSFTSVNQINDLLIDGQTVWAATEGGLARWDLATAQVRRLTTDNGMPSNHINALAVDADGALWLGTDRGAVHVRPDGTLRRFTVKDGLADESVYRVFVAADGAVWFGTGDGATRLERTGEVHTMRFADSPHAPVNVINVLAQAPDGAIWLGTNDGIRVLYSDGRQRFLGGDDVGDRVIALTFAPDGTVVIATPDDVRRLQPDRRLKVLARRAEFVAKGLGWEGPADVILDTAGAIWLATVGNSVFRLTPDQDLERFAATWSGQGGPISPIVRRVVPGVDGSVWFGTNAGISRLLPDGRWQTLQDGDGPIHHDVAALASTPDGAVWVGTAGGLSRRDAQGQWQTVPLQQFHSEVTALAVDAAGDLWVGTNEGLFRVSRTSPEQIQTPDAPATLTHVGVTALAAGTDGSLWLGTSDDGVFRRDANGRWRRFSQIDGLGESIRINAIATGPDGSIWFGWLAGTLSAGRSGIGRLTPQGQWQQYGAAEGLPKGMPSTLVVLPDGALIAAVGGGVVRRSADGTWQTLFPPNSGEYGPFQYGPDGTIWIGTFGRGLLRLGANGAMQTFTTDDGLADNTVHALLLTPDGTLWIGTDGGLSQLAP
jgi:ligand-binding sensor domain-containing protein